MKVKNNCHCQLVEDAAQLLAEMRGKASFLPKELDDRVEAYLQRARHATNPQHTNSKISLAA